LLPVSDVSPFPPLVFLSFSFNAPPTPQIYTLSLHDALRSPPAIDPSAAYLLDADTGHALMDLHGEKRLPMASTTKIMTAILVLRSEEHTSELQSLTNLVCRLLLEKKKNIY